MRQEVASAGADRPVNHLANLLGFETPPAFAVLLDKMEL